MRKCFTRAFALLMAVLMVASQMVFVSVAEDVVEEKCVCDADTRTGEYYDHVDPTCGDFGYDVYVCDDCGLKYVGKITDEPTDNHVTNIPEATCTEDCVCMVCFKIIEEARGHNYIADVVAPSCEFGGYTTYTCDGCGDSYVTDEVEPTGHDWVLVDSKPVTCFENGIEVYVCSLCRERRQVIDHANGIHLNYVAEKHEATCYDDAYTVHTCNACGWVLVENFPGTAKNHSNRVEYEAKAPTCLEDGYKAYFECLDCGYNTFEVVPATGHAWGNPVEENYVAPTCTEIGSVEFVVYCDNCGVEKDHSRVAEELEPTGHDLGKAETVAPTCIHRGYDIQKCKNCDYEIKFNLVAPDFRNHKGVLEGRVEPTCTEDGFTGTVTCDFCGETLNRGVVIPALGHAWGETIDGKEPTCTEDGWTEYHVCAVCELSTKVDLPATGHTPGRTERVLLPTCEEDGYTIYECQVCLEIFKSEYTDALGHDWSEEVVAPTCTEIGYTLHICNNDAAHNYVDSEVEALGHDVVIDEAVAPTCTEEGLTEGSHCGVCGVVILPQRRILPTDHTPGKVADNVITEVTCVEDGLVEHFTYCASCGELIDDVTEVVPALGHAFKCRFTTPTVDTISYQETFCTICGKVVERIPVDEEVVFSYEAYGINGEEFAVNSGYVTVQVYADVVTEYARIYGVDIDLEFTKALSFVEGTGALFNNFVVKEYADGAVKFTVDNGLTDGTIAYAQGRYLVATLTFKVAGSFYTQDATFTMGAECAYARDTALENQLIVDFGNGANIHVARLGDIFADGNLTVEDTNAFFEWYTDKDNEGAYNYIIDMDKDGDIDLDDLDLLRMAIVHDDEYLYVG